jgi:hypothetical protein
MRGPTDTLRPRGQDRLPDAQAGNELPSLSGFLGAEDIGYGHKPPSLNNFSSTADPTCFDTAFGSN